MGFAWESAENALRAFVVSASGLAESNVIWADQDSGAPGGTYITIKMGDLVSIAPAVVSHNYDVLRDAGEEIEFVSQAWAEFTASISCFTDETVGLSAARQRLGTVKAAIALPTYRDALNAVGLGVLDEGSVSVVNAIYGADFEGRAVLEVRFCVVESASVALGYIAEVEAPVSYIDNVLVPIP